ncbi:MAG: DUF4062 domain-containing protein [Bacteroidetes bacterium]|nr:DUF4062 domain-containing protein [Bacteroidota bacterium]
MRTMNISTSKPIRSSTDYARLFISSTFLDMEQERTLIVNRVFPILRQLCNKLSVSWGEVDLRWGIRDEDVAENRALSMCILEIERCQFFLGILGERYGWVPSSIPEDVICEAPWLKNNSEVSITEIEFRHAALNDQNGNTRALFYFRDPAYINSLPIEKQHVYRETPTNDEIRNYGLVLANERAAGRRERLANLKKEIIDSPYGVRECYANPEEFANFVSQDLELMILHAFEKRKKYLELPRWEMSRSIIQSEHKAVFVERPHIYSILDEFIDSVHNEPFDSEELKSKCADITSGYGDYLYRYRPVGEPSKYSPFLLTGDPGSGKSALVAAWERHRNTKSTNEVIITQYIGEASLSRVLGHYPDTLKVALEDICNVVSSHFGNETGHLSKPNDVWKEFNRCLNEAAKKIVIILIFDGIDKIGIKELKFLLESISVFPIRLKTIFTSTLGDNSDCISEFGAYQHHLQSLSIDERKAFYERFLCDLYGKRLPTNLLQKIIDHPLSGNPKFLRMILEELRVFRSHTLLGKKANEIISSKTQKELYAAIIKRYSSEYEIIDSKGAVKSLFSLVWGSRRGLFPVEIIELLSFEGISIDESWLSMILSSSHRLLIEKDNLVTIPNNTVRDTVKDIFLSTSHEIHALHCRLADYFDSYATPDALGGPTYFGCEIVSCDGTERMKEEIAISPQIADELPWQLERAGLWDNLGDLISKPAWLKILFHYGLANELVRYGMQVDRQNSNSFTLCLEKIYQNPIKNADTLFVAGHLLLIKGHYAPVEQLYQLLKKICIKNGLHKDLVIINEDIIMLQGHSQLLNSNNSEGVHYTLSKTPWSDYDNIMDRFIQPIHHDYSGRIFGDELTYLLYGERISFLLSSNRHLL